MERGKEFIQESFYIIMVVRILAALQCAKYVPVINGSRCNVLIITLKSIVAITLGEATT